jgi:hypothetical protein
MFAGEVDSSLGLGKCIEEADLARCVEREGAALPGVEPLAVGDAAFESIRQLGEDLPRLR